MTRDMLLHLSVLNDKGLAQDTTILDFPKSFHLAMSDLIDETVQCGAQ